MKILLLSLLLIANLSFAKSMTCVTPSGRPETDGDEEFSRSIYFTVEDEGNDYRIVLAHIPIPKEFSNSKIEKASIMFFMPTFSKAPVAQVLTKHEKVNGEVTIKFAGIPKSEIEARVQVEFKPNKLELLCRSYLVSTYKFIDSSKGFRSGNY